MADGPMRLNIGCGDQRPHGWVNVDPFPAANNLGGVVVANPLDDSWPWSPGTFDGAVCHHVLQMIEYPLLVPWLTIVRYSMKDGAVLRVTVPDLLGAFDAYDELTPGWFPIADELEESIDGKLCVYLSQAGATRSVFTAPWLADLLSRSGFSDVIEHDDEELTAGPSWLCDLDARLGESILMEALA